MSTLPRFHCPVPLRAGEEVELPDAVVQHAVRALRLGQGERVILFNGEGGEFTATLTTVTKGRAAALVEEYAEADRESPLRITLLQALTSNDKMDWIVQKAVELGVAQIQPVLMERSVVRLAGERAEKRREHLQAVAISACEQCGRNRVPPVLPLADLAGAVTAVGAATRLLLSPTGAALRVMSLKPGDPLALLVGPEGGFSEAEALRLKEGWFAVQLGPRVLRTETAGLAGIAALQAQLGDWR